MDTAAKAQGARQFNADALSWCSQQGVDIDVQRVLGGWIDRNKAALEAAEEVVQQGESRCSLRFLLLVLLLSLLPTASLAGACEIGERGGWVPVEMMPHDAEKILANAKPEERDLLINSPNVEWFRNEDGAYLACLPGERSYCGQVNYHIQRTGDHWSAPFHYVISCG